VRILILDGNERTALAAARSLIAARYEVYVAARERLSLAGVSRRVRRALVDSDPLGQPCEYAAEVGALARDLGIRVLLPVTDQSVEALLQHGHAVSDRIALPFPSWETYLRGSDKAQALTLARATGLAVPETVVLTTPAERAHLPDAGFFPAVIKPHRSVIPADSTGDVKCKLGVSYVDNLDSGRRALETLPSGAFPVLLQRRVRGPGEGLFLLRWNGKIVGAFAHRRLREKPPAGGVSTYRESIPLDPNLLAAGAGLLAGLDWSGVAMIEGKRERDTGRFVFMELNGRLWGSLQLALDAGVDFPALLVACALGLEVSAVPRYALGVRSRWFWGDVDQLYLRLTRRTADLHLENGDASRLAALREFLRIRPGRDREEIWRWRDPAPFLVEALRWAGMIR
jgi:predicted ATP-grasp superfamily ATP-dependent carboligase